MKMFTRSERHSAPPSRRLSVEQLHERVLFAADLAEPATAEAPGNAEIVEAAVERPLIDNDHFVMTAAPTPGKDKTDDGSRSTNSDNLASPDPFDVNEDGAVTPCRFQRPAA